MSEELNFGDLGLELDEATQSRIAHAEFLEKVKIWGTHLGMICAPFAAMANALLEQEGKQGEEVANVVWHVATAMPTGVELLIEHINDLYQFMQDEAVKVLGAPFEMHKDHSENCDGTRETCGHQDHYKEGGE